MATDRNKNLPAAGIAETREIGVTGMTCEHCAHRVEKALRGVTGVKEVRVDLPAARATVTFDPTQTGISALLDQLRKAGYPPSPASLG
jgi:copper chaperone CopZ